MYILSANSIKARTLIVYIVHECTHTHTHTHKHAMHMYKYTKGAIGEYVSEHAVYIALHVNKCMYAH